MAIEHDSMMKKIVKIVVVLLFLSAAGILVWHYMRPEREDSLVLYGNVDQRQVELAFIDSERIAEVLVEEGDTVRPGQVLARLETRRLRDKIAALEAQVKASEVTLTRLKNGTRPEEIEQAKSAVALAEAEVEYAKRQYERYSKLWETSKNAISEKDLDESGTNYSVQQQRLVNARKTLELAEQGPRWEDIAEAEALLLLNQRNLEELKNRLLDAELKSPSASVVRRRLMEPGDMASPQRPVFSLAVSSPKWVRAYLAEPFLGLVKPGMHAMIHTDSHPHEGIRGTVGFISPVAEFTPKTVQTEELRTSLVYEIRLYVDDPEDRLRLGMPATVRFHDINAEPPVPEYSE